MKFSPLFLCITTLILLFSLSKYGYAQETNPYTEEQLAKLKAVTLSSAGLGYFEYEAEVDDNNQVILPIKREYLDDVLKSLVVLDDKVNIQEILYKGGRQDNPKNTGLGLTSKAFNNLETLLKSLKGTEVEVSNDDDNFVGKILTATLSQSENKNGIQDILLTLKGKNDIQTISVLHPSATLMFVDEKINRAFHESLNAVSPILQSVANGHNMFLTLELGKDHPDTIRFGYVVDSPIWKTSYRLLLQDKEKKVDIQGWAIIDNTTSTDWKNINLSLVSSSPAAFRQYLSRIYFKRRPIMPILGVGKEDILRGKRSSKTINAYTTARQEAVGLAMPAPTFENSDFTRFQISSSGIQNLGHQNISIPKGQSALIPFIRNSFEAKKVTIIDRTNKAYSAIRFTNKGQVSLPAGLMTVYQKDAKTGVVYIGDIPLPKIAPSAQVEQKYALDKDVHVQVGHTQFLQQVIAVQKSSGVYHLEIAGITKTPYLISVPPNRKAHISFLLSPKSAQSSFTLEGATFVPKNYGGLAHGEFVVTGKQAQKVTVTETTPQTKEVRLSDINSAQTLYWLQNVQMNKKAKDNMSKLTMLNNEIKKIKQTNKSLKTKTIDLFKEQVRLRDNLKSLSSISGKTSKILILDYMKKLKATEVKIEHTQSLQRNNNKTLLSLNKERESQIGKLLEVLVTPK